MLIWSLVRVSLVLAAVGMLFGLIVALVVGSLLPLLVFAAAFAVFPWLVTGLLLVIDRCIR